MTRAATLVKIDPAIFGVDLKPKHVFLGIVGEHSWGNQLAEGTFIHALLPHHTLDVPRTGEQQLDSYQALILLNCKP